MAVEPTDGEYERADALLDRINDMGPAMARRTVAHLLAAQRAAYEAVADELDTVAFLPGTRHAATRIRQVGA